MSSIPTDTYPVHTIITEGYEQAPAPAPRQESKAQQDYNALSLKTLHAALMSGQVRTASELLAEQEEKEAREMEAAKLEAQQEREAQEDIVTFGEIRSAIESGDAITALEEANNLHSADMKEAVERAVKRRFKLVGCPCCGGARFLSSELGDDACEVCDGLGLVEPAAAGRFEDAWAEYQHDTHAA